MAAFADSHRGGWQDAHRVCGALTDGCARSDSGMGHHGFVRYDATTAHAIEATGLVKRFGKTMALDGVDLVARQGRVLGVLGPNGAGKPVTGL